MTPPPRDSTEQTQQHQEESNWSIPWEGWSNIDKKSGSVEGLAAADAAAGADPGE
jgi:hypothetical protein